MSEEKFRRTYSKKYSLNSDSTSFNSSNPRTNKVISAQKIASSKLIDHLYSAKDRQADSDLLPCFNSTPEIGEWDALSSKCKEDPFLKAKM
jgi:hypothetical protein